MYTAFSDLLPKDHPYIRVHNEFWKTFGGANVILISVEAADGDIFNPAVLEKVKKLTETHRAHPGSQQLPDLLNCSPESERRSRHRLGHRGTTGHVARCSPQPGGD